MYSSRGYRKIVIVVDTAWDVRSDNDMGNTRTQQGDKVWAPPLRVSGICILRRPRVVGRGEILGCVRYEETRWDSKFARSVTERWQASSRNGCCARSQCLDVELRS